MINHWRPYRDRDALKVLIGGMLGMVVTMGIGRFVFTPILPLMQRDLAMSNTVAGWLAGLNYLGYLVGAIACTVAPQLLRSRLVTGGALLTSIATTFWMGYTLTVFWWGALRLFGGLASAILFIVISVEVSEALTRRNYGHWVGSLYGGVGLGIVLSGLIVPQLDQLGGWDAAWVGSGIIAALLSALGIMLGRRRELIEPIHVSRPAASGTLRGLTLLAAAYFCEGLGYVVTATFIVAIITHTPGLESFASYSWVAVGCAAIPSTILWPCLARHIGNRPALLTAYVVQAAGILVSIGATSVVAVVFSALTFGGTFMGIVAMTLGEGNRRMGADGRRAAALLTAAFSVGQMLGPILAGVLADRQAGFTLPLLLAAGCVSGGALLVALDRGYRH
ncbi:MAG: YbfB/YjiJ family MFS transporter [Desulfuromonadales bacterium]|nr:YbfB/YjiJ family MFS transporter [Desulfuromonadales bacterium]